MSKKCDLKGANEFPSIDVLLEYGHLPPPVDSREKSGMTPY